MHDRSRAVAEGILFTDQYQLTMAQLYFRAGLHEMDVQFDHFFRSYPDYGSHQAGYCINAGMDGFMGKPFELAALYAMLCDALPLPRTD